MISTETHFSWMRTRMSVERTLLSWVRTATALIGFGFALYQFFDRFNAMPGVAPARNAETPKLIALSLIAIGTIALAIAVRQYRELIAYLWTDEFRAFTGSLPQKSWTPAYPVAILLILVGIVTVVVLVTRA